MFQFPRFAPLRVPQRGGFPHSEIPGSKLVYKLPEAYRMLQRPSSPSIAKASTTYAYSLDHITPKTLEIICLVCTDMSHQGRTHDLE